MPDLSRAGGAAWVDVRNLLDVHTFGDSKTAQKILGGVDTIGAAFAPLGADGMEFEVRVTPR